MAGIDNLQPFKPGPDPRRGSKPKGSKHISTWIQEMLTDESFETLIAHPTKGYIEFKGAPLKAIILTAQRLAMAGDTKAMEWLAKHGWKPQLDITTNGKDLPTPILGGISAIRSDDSSTEAAETQQEN